MTGTTETTGEALPPEIVQKLWAHAEEMRPGLVEFARRLIRTPSLSGQEGAVAELVRGEMEGLGYDEVRVDQAGEGGGGGGGEVGGGGGWRSEGPGGVRGVGGGVVGGGGGGAA